MDHILTLLKTYFTLPPLEKSVPLVDAFLPHFLLGKGHSEKLHDVGLKHIIWFLCIRCSVCICETLNRIWKALLLIIHCGEKNYLFQLAQRAQSKKRMEPCEASASAFHLH